jgi:hypothetical protein
MRCRGRKGPTPRPVRRRSAFDRHWARPQWTHGHRRPAKCGRRRRVLRRLLWMEAPLAFDHLCRVRRRLRRRRGQARCCKCPVTGGGTPRLNHLGGTLMALSRLWARPRLRCECGRRRRRRRRRILRRLPRMEAATAFNRRRQVHRLPCRRRRQARARSRTCGRRRFLLTMTPSRLDCPGRYPRHACQCPLWTRGSTPTSRFRRSLWNMARTRTHRSDFTFRRRPTPRASSLYRRH